jgi:hypothetical protein
MFQAARVAFICAFVVVVGCSDEDSKPVPAQPGKLTLKSDGVGLVKTTSANGTSMKLDGQFQSAAIARRNADGTLTVECHDEQPHAEAFMSNATTTAAPELQ